MFAIDADTRNGRSKWIIPYDFNMILELECVKLVISLCLYPAFRKSINCEYGDHIPATVVYTKDGGIVLSHNIFRLFKSRVPTLCKLYTTLKWYYYVPIFRLIHIYQRSCPVLQCVSWVPDLHDLSVCFFLHTSICLCDSSCTGLIPTAFETCSDNHIHYTFVCLSSLIFLCAVFAWILFPLRFRNCQTG